MIIFITDTTFMIRNVWGIPGFSPRCIWRLS